MPQIVLSDFVDIAHTSGMPKATKVAEVKNRGPYDPRFDFYKPLRERIEFVHQRGLGKDHLKDVLTGLKDRKKINIYPDLVTAYRKWWGRKELPWFTAPRGTFSDGGVDVVVNPELGLIIGDVPHVVKLHFKTEPLSRSRAEIVTHLIEMTLRPKASPGTVFALLDVRSGRLVPAGDPNKKVNACLRAELAYIANIWPSL